MLKLVCVATPHPEPYLLAFQSLLVHDLLAPHPYIKLGEHLVVRISFSAFTSSTTVSEPFDIALSLKCFLPPQNDIQFVIWYGMWDLNPHAQGNRS